MAEPTKTQTQPDREFDATATLDNETKSVKDSASPRCPKCGCAKVWRDGNRYSMFGDKIQRWLCRGCGLRFSDLEDMRKAWSTIERLERIETKALKSMDDKTLTRQICVSETKNLGTEQATTQNVPESKEDIKGKLVQFAWRLKQDG
jgi:transposase-like protein